MVGYGPPSYNRWAAAYYFSLLIGLIFSSSFVLNMLCSCQRHWISFLHFTRCISVSKCCQTMECKLLEQAKSNGLVENNQLSLQVGRSHKMMAELELCWPKTDFCKNQTALKNLRSISHTIASATCWLCLISGEKKKKKKKSLLNSIKQKTGAAESA